MARRGPTGERLFALFLFGALAFAPPLMLIFDREAYIAGIPILYIYLFAAWAGLIGLGAWIVERYLDSEEEDEPEPRSQEREGGH